MNLSEFRKEEVLSEEEINANEELPAQEESKESSNIKERPWVLRPFRNLLTALVGRILERSRWRARDNETVGQIVE